MKTEINSTTNMHSHNVIELVLCYSNSGKINFENGSIDFKMGRTILIPPNCLHNIDICNEKSVQLKIFCMTIPDIASYLSPAQAGRLSNIFPLGISFADHQEDNRKVTELGDFVEEGIGQHNFDTQQVNWSLVSIILALHVKQHQHYADRARMKYKNKVVQIIRWIDEHLMESLKIDQVAVDFGMSRSLFSREFRRHTGKSFIEYCNVRRIEKAAMALATTQVSIANVAFSCGFSNLSNFHRQFKSVYGLAPGAFRSKMIEEGGV